MRQSVKVGTALGVLLVGGATASLFLKEATDARPLGSDIEPLVRRAEPAVRPLMELRTGQTPPLSNADEDSSKMPSPLEPAALSTLPPFSRDYPSSAQPGLHSSTTHKVIDGDTLARLAERYLGSAERQRELYDANRDVLSDPELLPIGAVLRVPAREARR